MADDKVIMQDIVIKVPDVVKITFVGKEEKEIVIYQVQIPSEKLKDILSQYFESNKTDSFSWAARKAK